MLLTLIQTRGLGIKLANIESWKDIAREIMAKIKEGPQQEHPPAVFVDLPRSLPRSRYTQLWGGIEEAKNGHAWDDRYSFRELWFNPPVVWVFTNKIPKRKHLSIDRWCFYQVESGNLIQVNPYEKYGIEENTPNWLVGGPGGSSGPASAGNTAEDPIGIDLNGPAQPAQDVLMSDSVPSQSMYALYDTEDE